MRFPVVSDKDIVDGDGSGSGDETEMLGCWDCDSGVAGPTSTATQSPVEVTVDDAEVSLLLLPPSSIKTTSWSRGFTMAMK